MSHHLKAFLRVISIILTVATLLTVLPLTIFAEEFEGNTPETIEEEQTSQQDDEPFDPNLPKDWRYDYYEKSAGAAGIVRLNEGTQLIEIIRDEFALLDSSADLGLKRIFSQQSFASLADFKIASSPYGKSWFTNLNNIIAFDEETGLYKFFDSNGDIRYFENMGSVALDGKVQWNEVDQETLHLSGDVLWLPVNKTIYGDYSDIEIKTSDNLIKSFDPLGRLIKLTASGKTLKIQYVDENLIQIDKIVDTNENEYRFVYENDLLSNIRFFDANGEAIQSTLPDATYAPWQIEYSYDNNGDFISATTIEDYTATYEYNNQGLPIKVQGSDDHYFTYAYDNSGKVSQIIDYALVYVVPEIDNDELEFTEESTTIPVETTTEVVTESPEESQTEEETTSEFATATSKIITTEESTATGTTEVTTSEEETGNEEDYTELELQQEFVEQEIIDIILGNNYLVTFNSNRIDPITKQFDEYGRYWFNVSAIEESEAITEEATENGQWLNSNEDENSKESEHTWRRGNHSLQAGRAGSANIDDTTQTLTAIHPELSLPGNIMPVSIERHYSTANIQNAALFGVTDSPYGANWILNYNRLLQYDANTQQYVSLRQDGTLLYYTNSGEINNDGEQIWKEVEWEDVYPSGTRILIPGYVVNPDNYSEIKLVNADKQIESFDAFGRLSRITKLASTPSSLSISYISDSKLAINKIIDGVGREFRFTYAGGFLSAIQCFNANGEAIWVGGENKAPTVIEKPPTVSSEPQFLQQTFTFTKNLADLNQETVSSTGSGNHTGTISNSVIYAAADYKLLGTSDHKTIVRYTGAKNAVESFLNKNFSNGWSAYNVNESIRMRVHVENSFASVSGVNKAWFWMAGSASQSIYEAHNGASSNGSHDVGRDNIASWTQGQTPPDIIAGVEGIRNMATQTGYRTTKYVPNDGTCYVIFSGTVVVPNPKWHPPIANPPEIIDHGSKELKIQFIYDAQGNFTGATYLDGEATSYNYTSDGKLSKLQNLDGKQLKYTYNQDGQVSAFGTYYQDGNQTLPSEAWQIEKTQPDEEGKYSVNFTSSYGVVETSEYDMLGRCWVEKEQNEDKESNITNSENLNQFGLPEQEISANGFLEMIKESTYTENGNYLESQTDVNGVTTNYDFYNDSGRLLSKTDAEGNTENYLYDPLGMLTRISRTVSGLSNGNEIFNEYSYENDRVKEVKHNGYTYSFEYDAYGNATVAKVDGQTTVTTSYLPGGRGLINEITYANGGKVHYSYENNKVRDIAYGNSSAAYTFDYNQSGTLLSVTDHLSGRYIKYNGASASVYITAKAGIDGIDENTLIYSIETLDDGIISENFFGLDIQRTKPNSVKDETTNEIYNSSRFEMGELQAEIFLTQDAFGRPIDRGFQRPNGSGITSQFGYRNISDTQTTWQINNQTTKAKDENGNSQSLLDINLTYDNRGNISEILSGNEVVTRYKYDGANQIIREDNIQMNRSVTYTYDVGGNITARKYYAFTLSDNLGSPSKTLTFTYNKDKLVSASDGTKTVNYQYDELGNPLNLGSSLWTPGNGSEFDDAKLTWRGKQLMSIRTDEVDTIIGELGDSPDIKYEYNENGLRSRKIIHSELLDVSYEYVWNGTQLVGYLIYQNNGGKEAEISWIRILYDDLGEALGYMHGEGMDTEPIDTLWFVKNTLGDTVGLYSDTLNEQVVTFHYDAWGNVSMQNADAQEGSLDEDGQQYALMTPLFYRGYLYDVETGFYYLQNRYYSPYLGRFISPDRFFDTGTGLLGTNRYAYCDNNPIMYIDPTGEAGLLSWAVGVLQFGAAIVVNGINSLFSLGQLFVDLTPYVIGAFISDPIGFVGGLVVDAFANVIAAVNAVSGYLADLVTPVPSSVSITRSTDLVLGVDETYTLSAKIMPENANVDRNKAKLSWKSYDTSIATIDANGKITAKKAGTVTIGLIYDNAARHKYLNDHISVTVYPKPTSVKFIEGSVTKAGLPSYGAYISVGESLNIDSIFYDKNGKVTNAYNRNYRIESVTVNGMLQQAPTFNGKSTDASWFKGLKKGTATIRFTSYLSNLSTTFQIKVVDFPTAKTFGIKNARTLLTNESEFNFNINPAEFMCLEWSSSNKNVLEVKNKRTGNMKIKSAGYTEVTVCYWPQGYSYGWTHTVGVYVQTPTVAVTGVSLNTSGVTFSINSSSYRLVATVLPNTATNKTITWSSNKTSIATVNSNGDVTPKGIGTATITAKSTNGKTANCAITVLSSNNFQLFLDGREFGTSSDTYKILNNLNNRNNIFSSTAAEVRLMAREKTPAVYAQNKVTTLLNSAVKEMKERKVYWDNQYLLAWNAFNYDPIYMATKSAEIELNRALNFMDLVNNDKKYDIKNIAEWQYPYKTYHGKTASKTQTPFMYFNGELWTSENLGNFAFGYYGAPYGYSITFLNIGAGLQQLLGKNRDWSWYGTYFDDPNDYYQIQRGYSYYITGSY